MTTACRTAVAVIKGFSKLLGFEEIESRLRERRWNLRVPARFEAVLAVGGVCTRMRGVDIGRHGAGLLSSEPLPVGREIYLRVPALGLMGFAEVRHCSCREPGSYRIGVQFRDRLHRDPAMGGFGGAVSFAPAGGVAWDGPAD